MTRQQLAIIALLVAVPLFVIPLVSPIPDQEPHLKMTREGNGQLNPIQYLEQTVRYQTLSSPAQHLFATLFQDSGTTTVPLDEVPKPWARLAPDDQEPGGSPTYLQVVKNGRYYEVRLERFLPQPPLPAVVLRLGPLVAAIAVGNLAGYFLLTAEK